MGRIGEAEFRSRLARCDEAMRREGLDVLIAYASQVQYGSVRYFTGYEPWLTPEEWTFAVITPGVGNEIALLTNSPWDFWDFNRRESTWVSDVIVGSDWVGGLVSRLPKNASRVGIAGWSGFPAPVYDGLRKAIPRATFADATALVRELRAIKSDAEIEILQQVGDLSDIAGRVLFETARPGVTEREVVARIDAALMTAGAELMGYPTILGSGPRTVAACFQPTDRRIADGDVVQLDCAPMLDGYKADFSRVVLAGASRPAAQLRLVETAAEMYDACAAKLRAGTPCSEVARAGLAAAERRGYTRENLFKSANYPNMVFMAHGLGLENPEPPGMLTLTNHRPLEPNMVINLEPILLDPGVGGARIETSFVVTNGDPIALTSCEIRPWAVRV
ncbi:MAG TPA: Xaa-Pro peptidase family protein [Candidatus Limnocylindria bacterium]|nr:Xaa-Pro peptidase family protein [Candidatus Limnocylindria bacterium]